MEKPRREGVGESVANLEQPNAQKTRVRSAHAHISCTLRMFRTSPPVVRYLSSVKGWNTSATLGTTSWNVTALLARPPTTVPADSVPPTTTTTVDTYGSDV